MGEYLDTWKANHPDEEEQGEYEVTPDSTWTKAEIVGWLNSQGVEANTDDYTKNELLELVAEVTE